MAKRWVIGDIHGCSKTLKALVEERLELVAGDSIFFLGDYIDRGPDSRGVIDFISQLSAKGILTTCLRGNHEQQFLDAYAEETNVRHWLMNSGAQTLTSFNVTKVWDIPYQYLEFAARTVFFVELEKVILVHAGLNTLIDNPFEDKHAMLWLRNSRVEASKIKYKKVIHGHTPLPYEVVQSQLKDLTLPSINLDSGCVYTGRTGMGHLSALDIDNWKIVSQQNIE